MLDASCRELHVVVDDNDFNFSHLKLKSFDSRQLQKAVPEEDRRKYLSGEWFYEVKSQRHQDRIHGSDIIMASMKQRKPSVVGETKTPTLHTCSSYRNLDLMLC